MHIQDIENNFLNVLKHNLPEIVPGKLYEWYSNLPIFGQKACSCVGSFLDFVVLGGYGGGTLLYRLVLVSKNRPD